MKKLLLSFCMLAMSVLALAQDYSFYYELPPWGYQDNVSVCAFLKIDGEIIDNPALEIGGFCVDTCRMHSFPMYASFLTPPHYVYMPNLNGFNGDVIYFKVYNHETEEEMDLECLTTIVYDQSVSSYGTIFEPMSIEFQTPVAGIVFTGATNSNWNDASNWNIGEVPADGSDVIINADVVIPDGFVAVVGNVTNNATITVADGGQLKHQTPGLVVTMEKEIESWTDNGGYYLIAAPFEDGISVPAEMIAGSYDLYAFDQSSVGAEWQNYKVHHFGLAQAEGYLYANISDITLSLTGPTSVSDDIIARNLVYDSESNLPGFNLMGNPFTCNTYLVGGRDYLVLNGEGSAFLMAESATIPPMAGFFVEAADDGEVLEFTTEMPMGKHAILTLGVNDSRGNKMDVARIRFNEGHVLNKFMLDESASKLYFPQDDKEYTVVVAEPQGQMPLNFHASESDEITLTIAVENIDLDYLHLIDNQTNADIDLLANPSYTFSATPNDEEARFELVFGALTEINENADAPFAYVNNGSIIVEGQGTLQVNDMLGRVLCKEQIEGRKSINLSAGVYVLRLINGDTVRTQKIINEL